MADQPSASASSKDPHPESGGIGPPAQLSHISEGPSLLVAALIGFLIILSLDTETLMIIPLLGKLRTEFQLSAVQVAWVLSASGIAAGATIPLMTRLGDIFGLRKLLLVTLTIVAIGNIICALAPNAGIFLFGRVIVGINAALPLYYAILRAGSVSKEVMNRFVGIITVCLGVAVALSFILGGLIVDAGSVRLVLLLIAILSIFVIGLVWWLIREVPVRTRTPIDWIGAVLLAGGLGLFVLGISQGNQWKWTSTGTILCIVAGVAILAAWAVWELRHPHPLIHLHTVISRDMWPGFAAAALAGFIGTNTLLVLSSYVQTPTAVGYGFGDSVLKTAFYLLPGGLMLAIGGAFVTPLIDRIGVRQTMLLGATLSIALYLWFAWTDWTPTAFIILSFALGVVYSTLYTAGVSSYLRAARPGEQGMITGSARSASTAIQAVGPAVITALLTASLLPSGAPEKNNYTHVWIMFFIVSLLAIVCALFAREPKFDQRLAEDAVELESDDQTREART